MKTSNEIAGIGKERCGDAQIDHFPYRTAVTRTGSFLFCFIFLRFRAWLETTSYTWKSLLTQQPTSRPIHSIKLQALPTVGCFFFALSMLKIILNSHLICFHICIEWMFSWTSSNWTKKKNSTGKNLIKNTSWKYIQSVSTNRTMNNFLIRLKGEKEMTLNRGRENARLCGKYCTVEVIEIASRWVEQR